MSEFDCVRADFETGRLFWVAPPKNHAQRTGSECGAINTGNGKNKNYWQVRIGGKVYKRSRLMFFLFHGYWPLLVDHINGNSLDDRPINLRDCDYCQNAQNVVNRRVTKYGLPRGVSRNGSRFAAKITVNRKSVFVGNFQNETDASNAYEAARKEAFGEFA